MNVTHPHEPAPRPLRPWPILTLKPASTCDEIKLTCSEDESDKSWPLLSDFKPRVDVNSHQRANEVFSRHNDDKEINLTVDDFASRLTGAESHTAEVRHGSLSMSSVQNIHLLYP